jgi:hypothetical protein
MTQKQNNARFAMFGGVARWIQSSTVAADMPSWTCFAQVLFLLNGVYSHEKSETLFFK